MTKILCIDGFNFLHRARAGFKGGDFSVVFNFFRNLRALVELHSPSRVYFVLEGHPKWRYSIQPDYKANRRLELPPDDAVPDPKLVEKLDELVSFYRQAHLITDLLERCFPVSVVRHPDHEGDDVIFNLVKRSSSAVPWVIVSTDTDFTQLLVEFPNVRLYNPVTKAYVEAPDFDYVTWKALRGDGSDNIPGLPGIGDKTADGLVCDPDGLARLFEDKAMADQFSRNYLMIRFMTWSDDDALQMTCSTPSHDWSRVQAAFGDWAFQSLLKEKTWQKFQSTFDPLWGPQAPIIRT